MLLANVLQVSLRIKSMDGREPILPFCWSVAASYWISCAFHLSVKMLVCETSGVLKKPNPQTALLNFSENYQYLGDI